MKRCEKCKDYAVCALTDKKPKCFTDRKTESTISKMEQVEDEPKTQMKTQNSNLTFEKADERCKGCNHYKLTCDLFSEICKYEPTDEPKTNGYQTFNGTSVYVSRFEDEPQTEREGE